MNENEYLGYDTSMLETSQLPGSFPVDIRQPHQENPPNYEYQDCSFLPNQRLPAPMTPSRQRVLQREAESLPRSPVFSFKAHKPVYPNLLDDINKENDTGRLKFNLENDVLTKKFSKKLSNTVLQELDSRLNDTEVNDYMGSPRSKLRRYRNQLKSPRTRVHDNFTNVHDKRFDKMDSINNHYSVHNNAEDARIVRKKRRTLVGPEEIMEDLKFERSHKSIPRPTLSLYRSLDPKQEESQSVLLRERRLKEPLSRLAAPRRTLDPRSDTRATPHLQTRRNVEIPRQELPRSYISRPELPRPLEQHSRLGEPRRTLDPRSSFRRTAPSVDLKSSLQKSEPKINSAAVPAVSGRSSFLRPTLSSLNRSTSNYEILQQLGSRSSSTVHTPRSESISRSKTASNLNNVLNKSTSTRTNPRITSSISMHGNMNRMTSSVSMHGNMNRMTSSTSMHGNMNRITSEQKRPVWR